MEPEQDLLHVLGEYKPRLVAFGLVKDALKGPAVGHQLLLPSLAVCTAGMSGGSCFHVTARYHNKRPVVMHNVDNSRIVRTATARYTVCAVGRLLLHCAFIRLLVLVLLIGNRKLGRSV